ncbi:MAG: two-component system response regulator [Flexistipes sinusarabici]|uniref:Two-component system response regulator n=1 Tax=Flexistipes sinusarabici TaxID=2352 RepID=A0A5D0MQB9_FLESI|nr:two-component system response regulator [Flexistipes sinusarabici]TYB33830.1 MAG: two-component system response regulator [Flexistipes sinusarabici]
MIYLPEKTSIMLVDDTPENLKYLEDILQKEGYNTSAFPSGAMALRAADRTPPDLILLDIMMPEMDGFEVCHKLKEDEKLKEIPVIFISALDDTTNKVRAFSEGGVDYVTKPFQQEEVLSRIKTHLNLRRSQQELQKYSLHLEELVDEKVKEISESQVATIHALSSLAEHRDDDTGQHIRRTQHFCKLLAEQLRKNPKYSERVTDSFIYNIYCAAPLHDIGKVGIADNILLKPGKLTDDEFEIMKGHVMIGVRTLESVQKDYPNNEFINMGVRLTKSHHEKWDGSGYPDGLSGEDIPLCGRIMAVVDVYDALRSKRPYKEPFPHEKAVEIIQKDTGTHFDPDVAEAFMMLEKEFARIRDELDS